MNTAQWLLVAGALVGFWGGGSLFGIAILCIAVHTLFQPFMPQHTWAGYILLFTFIAAAPFAAWLAVHWLQRFCFASTRALALRRSTYEVAMLFSLVLMLGTSSGFRTLTQMMVLIQEHAVLGSLTLFTAMVGAACFCGAMVSLSLMLLCLSFEIPFRLVAVGTKTSWFPPFEALRPLLVVGGFGLGVFLMIDLFAAELGPSQLRNRATQISIAEPQGVR